MGLGRWLWRNKRTVAGVTVVAAGAYSAYRLWKRGRSLEQLLLESLLGAGPAAGERRNSGRWHSDERLRQHYEVTQRECEAVLERQLSALRAQLHSELDTQAVRRRMRAEGTELDDSAAWGELKVLGFARAVGAIYALVLLNMRLRVHLNIVARHYVAEVMRSAAAADGMAPRGDAEAAPLPAEPALSKAAKLRFLSVDSLCQSGFAPLFSAARAAAHRHVLHLPLDLRLDASGLSSVLLSIRDDMEGVPGGPEPPVHTFLLAALQAAPGVDETHAALVAEAEAVYSSEPFHGALSDLLDAAFQSLDGRMAQVFEAAGAGGGAAGDARTAGAADGGQSSGDNCMAVALLTAFLIKIPTWALPDAPQGRTAGGGAEGAGEGVEGPEGRKGVGEGGIGGAQGRRWTEQAGGEWAQGRLRPDRPPGVLSTLGGVGSLGVLCWGIFSTQPGHANAA